MPLDGAFSTLENNFNQIHGAFSIYFTYISKAKIYSTTQAYFYYFIAKNLVFRNMKTDKL